MNPLVSVIVPVFKVEEYLLRCLDSLHRQSLSNIEILLIDDASPDKCGEICDAYSIKDERFKVFHNKINQGLSVARNIGVTKAHSNYLMFVDSDDWVHEDFCKDAYECAERYQADLVMFRHEFIGDSKFWSYRKNVKSSISKGYKTCLEAMDLLQKDVGQVAWNKLYRKELFRDISYPPGYLHEDVGTTYKLVWRASRIYCLDKILYYYYRRNSCISRLKTKKNLNDWIEMLFQQYHDLATWGYPSDKLDFFLKNVALFYCIKKKPDNLDKHYIFCSNVLLSSKNIPSNFVWKKKLLFFLFKFCRPLFELSCTLFNQKYC